MYMKRPTSSSAYGIMHCRRAITTEIQPKATFVNMH